MIDIIEISRYRDGGTSIWIPLKDKNGQIDTTEILNLQSESEKIIRVKVINKIISKTNLKYYLDNRINSKTKGELYDRYPSDEGAKILDKSQFNFVTIEQLIRESKINDIIK